MAKAATFREWAASLDPDVLYVAGQLVDRLALAHVSGFVWRGRLPIVGPNGTAAGDARVLVVAYPQQRWFSVGEVGAEGERRPSVWVGRRRGRWRVEVEGDPAWFAPLDAALDGCLSAALGSPPLVRRGERGGRTALEHAAE